MAACSGREKVPAAGVAERMLPHAEEPGDGQQMKTLAGISVLVAAYNPLVTTILQSEQHPLLSGRTMLITLKNRETAQMKTFPVNYLRGRYGLHRK